MDKELDKYICTELRIRVKPLNMFDLITLIERYKNDYIVKKHKHKIYGLTICTYRNRKLYKRYYWDAVNSKLKYLERYARCPCPADPALDFPAGSEYTIKMLYTWLIDYLCYRKGPEWICVKRKNGKR